MSVIKDNVISSNNHPDKHKNINNNLARSDMKYKNENNKTETRKEKNSNSFSYLNLFEHGNSWDLFCEAVATVTSILVGMIFPGALFLSGYFHDTFTEYGKYQQCGFDYSLCHSINATSLTERQWNATTLKEIDSFEATSIKYVYYMLYCAIIIAVLAALQVTLWSYTANRQVSRIQKKFFFSVLRQDISYHDTVSSGQLNAIMSSDFLSVRKGMGEKTALSVQYVAEGMAGLVVAFLASWRLTLITLAICPLLILAHLLLAKVGDVYSKRQQRAYRDSWVVAEEAISNIHTVTAFGGQRKVVDRYATQLDSARANEIKKGALFGLFHGFYNFLFLSLYGFVFWYGSLMVIEEELTVGQVVVSITGALITSSCFGKTSAFSIDFSEAKEAGRKINETLARTPQIDVFSSGGQSPQSLDGEVKFNNVSFSYPSRSEIKILNGTSFTIPYGSTVAIVGESGSGKSTICRLIQRFYDCFEGEITIGGADVTNLDLLQHRDQIGVVSQEPVLFATTIAENIRWGREKATDNEIHEAAKQANAYDFIMRLPDKFDTVIGEGGGCISGGQKQRIAIARAIVRNPKILLLDEATSALDTESESIVHKSLSTMSQRRTTIIVAHRLSTIRDADKIIVMSGGRVVQEGNHHELIRNKSGTYHKLAWSQKLQKNSVTEDQDVARLLCSGGEKKKLAKLDKEKKSSKSLIVSLRLSKKSHKKPNSAKDLSITDILKYNKHEWVHISFACLFSLLAGAAMPLTAIMYANFLKNSISSMNGDQEEKAATLGLMFVGVAGGLFVAVFIESILFAKSGIELTIRLRKKAFQAVLRQSIEFFDNPQNDTGSLCKRLSEDAAKVHGCTGVRIGIILKNLSTLIVSLAIAFLVNWQLTLVVVGFVPCTALAELLKSRITMGASEKDLERSGRAGKISTEAINNIRTVTSFNKQSWFYKRHNEEIKKLLRTNVIKSISAGFIYGFYESILFFAYAAAFRMGVHLLVNDQITFDGFFEVLVAIVFGSIAIGENSVLVPNYNEAKLSAQRILSLIQKKPRIESCSDDGQSPVGCRGEVKFSSVVFSYPKRPTTKVLKKMEINVGPGKTLALVGSSGCGKSTTIKLLQRFYNTSTGTITLDGVDIRTLNVQWLRHQMGLVSQEPVLFDQSVADNIRFGDCSRGVSQKEIEEAARSANIHHFITTLPQGYETKVGSKGAQLSGGEKQRIAIARALIRNPKILLLDEATSALDGKSEKIVQEALDVARKGRTCIVIAHRLSTVRNADQIAVIDNGVVAEIGTHDELIATGGAYFRLVHAQSTLNALPS